MARSLTDRDQSIEGERTQSRKPDTTTPLTPPEDLKHSDWAERIERARRAREFGRQIRKGKPKSFRTIPGLGSRSLRHR